MRWGSGCESLQLQQRAAWGHARDSSAMASEVTDACVARQLSSMAASRSSTCPPLSCANAAAAAAAAPAALAGRAAPGVGADAAAALSTGGCARGESRRAGVNQQPLLQNGSARERAWDA